MLASMHFGNTKGTLRLQTDAAGSVLNTDSGLALILRK